MCVHCSVFRKVRAAACLVHVDAMLADSMVLAVIIVHIVIVAGADGIFWWPYEISGG